jgi:GC-rich sequence DNA-binding factor
MFNKKKNFRRKVSDSEEEPTADGASDQGSGSAVRAKEKAKAKDSKPRAPSLLSFGGDEDDEASLGGLKLKKEKKKSIVPSYKALGTLSKPGAVSEKPAGGIQTSVGEYTAERLAELKSGTRSMPGGAKKPAEPIMVLKGGFKPAEEPLQLQKVESTAIARVDSVQNLSSGLGKGLSYIPDDDMIRAAKLKREKLRQAQAAPDYVPLSSGGRGDRLDKLTGAAPVNEKKDAESSEDEGEVHTRMKFLGDVKKPGTGVSEKGVFGGGEQQEAEHDDEEDDRWEMEQMRKAVKAVKKEDKKAAGGGSGWGDLLQKRNVLSVANQGESALKSLRETLYKMKESEARARAQLRQNEERIAHAEESVRDIERGLADSSERYVYVQKLRDYVAELCDCLRDKGALIEELEEQMQKLHEERAAALSERREADISAEVAESEAAVSAAMAALGRGAGALAASSAAGEAAARFREGLALPPQRDEFGRDMNLQKRLEARRRAEARARRRARAQARRAGRANRRETGSSNGNGRAKPEERLEGETSSSESEDEVSAFDTGRGELLVAAEAVFRDADEEFRELSRVKQRLEEWKQKYPTAYRDAYCSLSAPQLFAPYVRLELLRWSPLYGEAGFDTMDWYQQLFEYGNVNSDGRAPDPDDSDGDMIPKLVEKVGVLHVRVCFGSRMMREKCL